MSADHLYIAWCLNLLIPCLVVDEDFVKVYEEVCRAANEKNKGIAMVHESVSSGYKGVTNIRGSATYKQRAQNCYRVQSF